MARNPKPMRKLPWCEQAIIRQIIRQLHTWSGQGPRIPTPLRLSVAGRAAMHLVLRCPCGERA